MSTSVPRMPGIVLGYHGCDLSLVEDLLSGRIANLSRSENDYDWLGSGLYFWENSYGRAMEWARLRQGKKRKQGRMIVTPAVVGAIIDRGNCLDLLEHDSIKMLKESYRVLESTYRLSGQTLPKNENIPGMKSSRDRILRRLDYTVIEYMFTMNERESAVQPPYDTVRSVFLEGQPIYPDAGFLDKSHIQICVRNPKMIIGYFKPHVEVQDRPASRIATEAIAQG